MNRILGALSMKFRLQNIFFLSSFLFLSSLTIVESAYAQAGQPKAHAPIKEYNFGTVNQGDIVEKEFVIKNQGDALLEITKVHADCGCTVAEPETKEIESGSSTKIKVSFNTKGFHGRKVKTVRVYTNDPLKRSLSLAMKGMIKREIEVEPARVSFKTISRSRVAETSQVVNLKISNSDEVEITNIVSRSEFVKIERISPDKLEIRLTEDVPFGIFRSNIAIQTSSKKLPVINLPIFANISGDMFFKPTDLSFGLLEGPLKETVTKKALLINNSAESITIDSARPDSKKVSVSFTEKKDKGGYELEVTLLKGLYGTLHSKIVVTTNHPDPEQREIILPVYGIISEKGA